MAITLIFPEPFPLVFSESAPMTTTSIVRFSGIISCEIRSDVSSPAPPLQEISKKKLIKAIQPLLVINCFILGVYEWKPKSESAYSFMLRYSKIIV